jgi:hypothetical protein
MSQKGSISDKIRCPRHVRLTPESGLITDIAGCQLGAIKRRTALQQIVSCSSGVASSRRQVEVVHVARGLCAIAQEPSDTLFRLRRRKPFTDAVQQSSKSG